jgi:transposase
MSGDLFVFIGRTRRRAKILHWDGTGLCLLSKRLSKGLFAAPWTQPGDGPIVLTTGELSLLLDGTDILARLPLSPPPYSRSERVLHWR